MGIGAQQNYWAENDIEVSFPLLEALNFHFCVPSFQGSGLCPLGGKRSDTCLTALYFSCRSHKNVFNRIAF